MSTEQIAAIAENAVLRPRSRLWELHELHVPFDTLTDSRTYEHQKPPPASPRAPASL